MIQSDAIFPTSGEGVYEGRGVDQILGWKEGVKTYLLGSDDAVYIISLLWWEGGGSCHNVPFEQDPTHDRGNICLRGGG